MVESMKLMDLAPVYKTLGKRGRGVAISYARPLGVVWGIISGALMM